MSARSYVHRITDPLVEEALGTFGAVVIEGPKWCGKTTSAQRVCSSQLRVLDPANQFQNRRFARADPSSALKGARPRLIDEWQEVPALWDAVRFECDESGEPGQFILTGSSVPRPHNAEKNDDVPAHSGAGRMGHVRMSTFSLFEMGESTGEVSLGGLMRGESFSAAPTAKELADYAEIICRGGWPASLRLTVQQSMRAASAYIDAVAASDLSRVDGVKRDSVRVERLIRSLARNESTLATNKVLRADMGEAGMADSTMRDYLDALRRVYFIEDVPAWSPALRSPVRIRSTAKHHLADPSLAAAGIGASPESLLGDLKTMGLLFESLAIHDLGIYARALGAKVMHYHDDVDLEVDAIVEMPSHDWGAFEIKLGSDQEDAAAASVLALEKKMVARGERPPVAKAVITGTGGFGYLREDGVQVVPLDRLGV